MTGSRATGIACLAGTKAVSSRHRRSPLVLCSTTHRGSSRDRSYPGRRRKASKGLCHSSRTSPGAAAVAHLKGDSVAEREVSDRGSISPKENHHPHSGGTERCYGAGGEEMDAAFVGREPRGSRGSANMT